MSTVAAVKNYEQEGSTTYEAVLNSFSELYDYCTMETEVTGEAGSRMVRVIDRQSIEQFYELQCEWLKDGALDFVGALFSDKEHTLAFLQDNADWITSAEEVAVAMACRILRDPAYAMKIHASETSPKPMKFLAELHLASLQEGAC